MAIKKRSSKHNKNKKKSFRVKTSKYKRKNRRHKRTNKKYNTQRGGANLLNAARYFPHAITNTYNGLVGNAAAPSYLPWTGHY